MNINLSDDAVHALNRAAAVAADEGLEAVAPRHVLVGVLSQGDDLVADACSALGVELDALPAELTGAPTTYGGHLPYTDASHEVLTEAVEFSSAAAHEAVTSLHLLLGVVRAPDGDAAEVIGGLDLDAAALEEAVRAAFPEDEASDELVDQSLSETD